jgi:hypothetical protein
MEAHCVGLAAVSIRVIRVIGSIREGVLAIGYSGFVFIRVIRVISIIRETKSVYSM